MTDADEWGETLSNSPPTGGKWVLFWTFVGFWLAAVGLVAWWVVVGL